MGENGYSPSIMQTDLTRCYLCGRSDQKLDRHEPFNGAYRQKSKQWGMWCMLCHWTCHQNGVHANGDMARRLRAEAQQCCMDHYGLSTDEFIKEFGKSFL